MVTTDHTQCLALTHWHFINNSVILDKGEGIELNENFNVDVWILNVQVLVVEDSRCSIKFKYLE